MPRLFFFFLPLHHFPPLHHCHLYLLLLNVFLFIIFFFIQPVYPPCFRTLADASLLWAAAVWIRQVLASAHCLLTGWSCHFCMQQSGSFIINYFLTLHVDSSPSWATGEQCTSINMARDEISESKCLHSEMYNSFLRNWQMQWTKKSSQCITMLYIYVQTSILLAFTLMILQRGALLFGYHFKLPCNYALYWWLCDVELDPEPDMNTGRWLEFTAISS